MQGNYLNGSMTEELSGRDFSLTTYFIPRIFSEVWRQWVSGYPRNLLAVSQLLWLQSPFGIPLVHCLLKVLVLHPGVVGGRVEYDVLVTPHDDVDVFVGILVG